jgi:hypothetical protein
MSRQSPRKPSKFNQTEADRTAVTEKRMVSRDGAKMVKPQAFPTVTAEQAHQLLAEAKAHVMAVAEK